MHPILRHRSHDKPEHIHDDHLHRLLTHKRGSDRIEFSSIDAPWIPDRKPVADRAPLPVGVGQLRLEKALLEGEILRAQYRLNTLHHRIALARSALVGKRPIFDPFKTAAVSYALDLSLLPVSNRTGRSSVIGGLPRAIRPVLKEYVATSGERIDLLL